MCLPGVVWGTSGAVAGYTALTPPVLACLRDLQVDNRQKILYRHIDCNAHRATSVCMADKAPRKLTLLHKEKRVATWEECRDMCHDHTQCEYFQYKVSTNYN